MHFQLEGQRQGNKCISISVQLSYLMQVQLLTSVLQFQCRNFDLQLEKTGQMRAFIQTLSRSYQPVRLLINDKLR